MLEVGVREGREEEHKPMWKFWGKMKDGQSVNSGNSSGVGAWKGMGLSSYRKEGWIELDGW